MNRSFRSALGLAAVAALCACAGGITPTPSTGESPSVMSGHFPSAPTYGVATHYVVYQYRHRGVPALAVLQAQTPQEFLDVLHAVPLANETIVYPDGSTQRTDSEGRFDAAASRYAQRHPQRPGEPDVPVRVTGSTPRLSLAINIFAPSQKDEASIASGSISSIVLDRIEARERPNFAFSCNPADYTDGRRDVTAGALWKSPTFDAAKEISYYPLFGFCGVDNSFFDTSMVVSVRHWSGPFNDFQPRSPEPIGCTALDNPCRVLRWYTDATFNKDIAWSSNPDVALWFEAWLSNWIRTGYWDVHQAILRVR